MMFKVYTTDKLFGFGTTLSVVTRQEVQEEASRHFHHTDNKVAAKFLLSCALKGQYGIYEDRSQLVEIVPIISIR